MGLSASQAKLLSITARLSDNELRAQSITAAKMALASQSSEASRKYINALGSTEFIYRTYDENGDKVYVPLTGDQLTNYYPVTAAQLNKYGGLKNQYGIINTDGQILVSETDAENYKNSKNVVEFIEKYGFSNKFEEKTYSALNEAEYYGDLDDYNKAYLEWEKNKPKESDYQKKIGEHEEYDYEMPNWDDSKYWIEDPDWEPEIEDIEGDGEVETWSLYEAFMNGAAGGCFSCSSNPASSEYNVVRHFNHTLGHLIGGDSSIWEGSWWWDTSQGTLNGVEGDGRILRLISEALVGKTACGEQGCTESHDHVWTYEGDSNEYPVHFDCGHEDCDGTELIYDKIKKLMTDMSAYANEQSNAVGDDSDPQWIALKQRYYHIIEHDLKGVIEDIQIPKDPPEPQEPPLIHLDDEYYSDLEAWENTKHTVDDYGPDEDAYNEALEEYEKEKPQKPDPEKYKQTYTTVTEDLESDEGLWYINLWHRMNGWSNYKVTLDGIDNGEHDSENNGVLEGDNIKSPANGMTENGKALWDILEDGLMNSQDWLKYALESGTVSLERVNYQKPTEMGTGLEHTTWTSIIYTNALDISEQTDEKAIAVAEAEYEQKTKEIENKEKQYDAVLKLLDTEHSALTQEYESAKTIITKNTERTLKIYNA